jgi:hypothetical protein
MDWGAPVIFAQYRALRALVERVASVEELIEEITQDPARYSIDAWSHDEYGQFYERIKGGRRYDHVKHS